MAEIRITIAEIIDIFIVNDLIPKEVSDLQISGDHIKFKYKDKFIIPKQITFEINIVEYSNGMLFLKLKSNWLVANILKHKQILEKKYLQYQHPKITFFLQQFLTDKTKMVHIESLNFNNGNFIIKTFNE
ncbi:MAG: hypothetical protein K9N07_06895 [Candidatus Cloacimonetes bacterium]|nr:hypothetical protein [Candidatus Cloacimonadota bacterium]